MVLSDAERRALHDIEVELLLQDPPLAVALARHRFGRARSRTRLAHDVVVGMSTLSSLLCLGLADSGGTQGGVTAAAFAALTYAVRIWRFPPASGTAAAGTSPSGSSTSGSSAQ